MKLTQAERDHAYYVLSKIHEPSKQRDLAQYIYAGINTIVNGYFGDLADSKTLTILQQDIDAFIGKTLLELVGYCTPHLAGVGVSISISDRGHVNYYPSEALQQLVQGNSPVKLFNPSATELEQLWAEHKSRELVASSRAAKEAPFLSRYKSGVSSIAPEFKHEKVSTLEELDSLEESLVVAGYTWGLDNAWEPESSRSFWHGWRNAQIDRGRIPPDAESTSLARAVVGILNERLTSKS